MPQRPCRRKHLPLCPALRIWTAGWKQQVDQEPYGGFQNGDTQNGCFIRENAVKIRMMTGGTPIFGNNQILDLLSRCVFLVHHNWPIYLQHDRTSGRLRGGCCWGNRGSSLLEIKHLIDPYRSLVGLKLGISAKRIKKGHELLGIVLIFGDQAVELEAFTSSENPNYA